MAKKSSTSKKPSGTAAIQTIEEVVDHDPVGNLPHEGHGESHLATAPGKPKRAPKATKPKPEPSSDGSVGVGDIKKAAAFANSIGGLDKAIALLQILKVAKEVQ